MLSWLEVEVEAGSQRRSSFQGLHVMTIIWRIAGLALMLVVGGYFTNGQTEADVPLYTNTPSPVFLSSLHPSQLDVVLEERLSRLREMVVNIYQDELKQHEDTLENVHRARRGTPAPQLPGDLWHSYVFNTGVGNREVVEVAGVESVGYLGPVDIVKVFPLNLPDFPAIYKSGNGRSYVEVNGSLEAVKVLNNWTLSSTGCDCGDGFSMECACCTAGGCLCKKSDGYSGDVCVACGSQATLCSTSGGEVTVEAATGFYYHVQQGGLQRVVVIAQGDTITFYKAEKQQLHELSSLSIGQAITHLGYGETFADHDGTVMKTLFLIIFSAGQRVQQFYKITVGTVSPAFAVGIAREWHAEGSAMKVMQSGGRVVVTVHRHPDLQIYELKEDFWMRFQLQKVQTLSSPLSSWAMFSTGFENYLVMVSTDQLTIYIQNGAEYEIMHVLSTHIGLASFDGILAMNMKSCRGEVVLIAGHGKDFLGLVFDPVSATPQFKVAVQGSLSVMVTDWGRGFAYTDAITGLAKVVLPTTNGAAMFVVKARLVDVKDPVATETSGLSQLVEGIKKEYNRQKDIMTAAERRLYYSVDSNTDVHANISITEGIFVNKTLTTETLEAENLVFPGSVLAGGVSLHQYLTFVAQLSTPDTVLDTLLNQITYIESALDDAVPASGTSRTIGGLKTVVAPHLHISTLLANSATLGQVLDATGARFSLNETLSSLVIRNTDLKIGGKKTFTKGLVIGQLYTNLLDDIPVGDLVTTTGHQFIEGAVFVHGVVAEDIHMLEGGTVGGVKLSEAVLLHAPATLGHVSSNNLEVEGNLEVMSGVISGVNINYLYHNALQLSGGELAGSLGFAGNVLIDNFEAPTMMGIDMVALMSNTVFRDEDAVISGKLIVSQSVVMEKDLQAGDINSKPFPGNYPLKTSKSALAFSNQKHFASIVIDKINFGSKGMVDGIDPRRFVTLSSSQEITGKKVFAKGVDIRGNLTISTKIVGGVNLDTIFATQGNGSLPGNWDFNVLFKKPVRMPGIVYGGSLNNMSLSTVAADLVYVTQDSVKLSGSQTFLNGLTVSDVQFLNTLNGENISSLLTTDAEEISSTMTFQNDLTFNELVVNLVDGVDLTVLLNTALYLNKSDQVVTGKKVFANGLSAGSLYAKGKVKGVDFQNVVTKTGAQTFLVPQTFSSAKFSSIVAHVIKMSDGFKINGVDISLLAERRVTLREAVNITAPLRVDGPVTVMGTLFADYINGYNVRDLKTSLVTDRFDSTIDGPVTFDSLVVEGSVMTKGRVGANGLSISAIAAAAAELAANNVFSGNVTFSSMDLRGDVGVEGLVAGVDLNLLQYDAVYTDQQDLQVITGTKIFESGFTVKGNMNTNTTNGVDLSTRLFTLHTDQVITAPYSFTNVVAEKNVYLQGYFNNIDLKRLASGALTSDDKFATGNIQFTNSVMVKHLQILKSLNGVDVQARLDDAVRLQETKVAITGLKTFMVNTRLKSLQVEYLNSVNLDAFLARVVSRNTARNMSGSVTVRGTVSAPWVVAQRLSVTGTIGGVDYKRLKASVVYLSRDQKVNSELVFVNGISVVGNLEAVLLNSYNVAQEYLTTSTDQNMKFSATFGNIRTTYISVAGKVNSFNLTREEANTMLSVGGQTVTGAMTVSGTLVVAGNLQVGGRIGRQVAVKLADQAILLDRNTVISGGVKFTSLLTTENLTSTTEVINYVYLPDLYKNAWYVDTPLTVDARFIFNSHITMKEGLVSLGPVDELDVARAYKESTTALAMFHNITEEFKTKYTKLCEPIASLYKGLQNSPYEADYFTHLYDQEIPQLRRSSISFTAWETTYLIVSYEGECYSDVFVWESQTDSFVRYQRLDGGQGNDWQLLQVQEKVYLVMAASSTANSCNNRNSTVWIVTKSDFVVLQVLAEGEHLSSEEFPTGPLLHVHGLYSTTTYTYLPLNSTWEQLKTSPPADTGVSVLRSEGVVVYWTSRGSTGRVFVNGELSTTLHLPLSTIHQARFYVRDNTLLLFLVVSTRTFKEPIHTLKVYNVKDEKVVCVAVQVLTTPGELTVFFAGNAASGSIVLVVTQDKLCPLVFTLTGEVLKLWTELSVPRVSWVQHFRIPAKRFPGVMDQYLLLGRNTNTNTTTTTTTTVKVYHLVMKGVAVPESNLTCTF
ncbi:uncharacterized protein [Procambarus clarkii]|uniref:uncharacterized protein isoform X2 n=1 Tax=Procambarus clarkii TaxID=6728 RepID=UPI0037431796